MVKTNTTVCPVSVVASLLSDTWTMLIIHHLSSNSLLRFSELERTLTGISSRTLSLKLKRLEEQGLMEKTEHGYSLSKLGKQLKPVIKAMEKFGKQL